MEKNPTEKNRTFNKIVSTRKKIIVGVGNKVLKQKLGSAFPKAPLLVQIPFNKSALIKTLVEGAQLEKKKVVAVLDSLKEVIIAHLVQKGPQQFSLPGLFMMKIKEKAATKARIGINPFTGQETTFAGKPAQRLIKIKALKALKEAIE